MKPDLIEMGDIVSVNIHVSRTTLAHRAEVLYIPVATGDSWIFKALTDNSIYYVSEGCTILLLEKGDSQRIKNIKPSGFTGTSTPKCFHGNWLR